MNNAEIRATTSFQIPPEAKPFPRIVTENELNYKEFSQQPEYVQANRELISNFVKRLPDNFRHVDIATGTGLIPQLIIDEAIKENKTGIIFGIDPNVTSLNMAKINVRGTDKVRVEFIEGMGQDLKQLLKGKIPPEGVDGVGILDALHEIKNDEDKISVVNSMADILKPEGLFVFNSAFTTMGGSKEGMTWGRWKSKAMELFGRKRDRSIQAMPIHSPEEYRKIIENAGLNPVYERLKIVMLTQASLEAISKYPAFSTGVLEDMPGQESIPIVDKCNAMINALRSLDIKGLPRVWDEIIAEKSATIGPSGTIFGK